MDKLLAIVGLGQKIYGRWLLYRLISGILVILILAIVASMLVGAAIIGLFYGSYIALVHAGFSQGNALFMVGGVGIGGTAIVIGLLIVFVKRLYATPQRILAEKVPQLAEAKQVLESFLHGLMREPEKTK